MLQVTVHDADPSPLSDPQSFNDCTPQAISTALRRTFDQSDSERKLILEAPDHLWCLIRAVIHKYQLCFNPYGCLMDAGEQRLNISRLVSGRDNHRDGRLCLVVVC